MDILSPSLKKVDGVGRKIRDLFPIIALLHSRWIDLATVGSQSANELVNLIMKLKQLESTDNWGVLKEDEETQRAVKYKIELQIQVKSALIEATFDDMCNAYSKAKSALEQLEFVYWSAVGEESDFADVSPVLRTAPLSSWIEWGTQLISMFTSDLTLKRSIISELTRVPADQRNTLLIYLNAWLSSPLVDPTLVSTITSMANAEFEEAIPTISTQGTGSATSTPSRSPSNKKSPASKAAKKVGKSASPKLKK